MNSPQQPQNSSQPQKTQRQLEQSSLTGFFAARRKVYPRAVSGKYRSLKWWAMIITLSIYYLAPLLRWDRGSNAPDQAILIDLPERRAYWFFIEIWPQEVYYLTAVLIFAAIALFFVTSLFGRVWCGYFCPQTVWTDLYYAVEKWVQGDRAKRQKLDEGPWTFEKIWKKGLTHLIWLLIAFSTGGAFVFYFNDAPQLWADIFALDVSPNVMGFVLGLTVSTYIMAGFAREQVCTYMCPYARFQSAMFDKKTLIIGYDEVRGEKRGKHKKGEPWDNRGHCVDCTACVQVCPVGIDIRNGLQMECIACGLCVDACNDIMDKLELPRGLIRYDTEKNVENRKCGKPESYELIRPRTIYYTVVMMIVIAMVLYGQLTRKPFELHVLHSRNPLFVTLSDGQIRNGYDIKILNRSHIDREYQLSVDGLQDYTLEAKGAGQLNVDKLEVKADEVGAFHVFVSAPAQNKDNLDVTFTIKDINSNEQTEHESMFISRGAR